MTRRTEHEEDVIINQADALDDPPEEPEEEPEDPSDWHSDNQEHMLNMYFSLSEYCKSQGVTFDVPFNSFCWFMYEPQPTPEYERDLHLVNMHRIIDDYCDTHELSTVTYDELCNFFRSTKK